MTPPDQTEAVSEISRNPTQNTVVNRGKNIMH